MQVNTFFHTFGERLEVNRERLFLLAVVIYRKTLLETVVDFSCPGNNLKKILPVPEKAKLIER